MLIYLAFSIDEKFTQKQKCYEILNVSSDSDQDTVRLAYINLVKKVHPDSGCDEASAERFAEVDNAFRILQAKYAKERRGIQVQDIPDVKEYDIKVVLDRTNLVSKTHIGPV